MVTVTAGVFDTAVVIGTSELGLRIRRRDRGKADRARRLLTALTPPTAPTHPSIQVPSSPHRLDAYVQAARFARPTYVGVPWQEGVFAGR
jgi:hypothetical protein